MIGIKIFLPMHIYTLYIFDILFINKYIFFFFINIKLNMIICIYVYLYGSKFVQKSTCLSTQFKCTLKMVYLIIIDYYEVHIFISILQTCFIVNSITLTIY